MKIPVIYAGLKERKREMMNGEAMSATRGVRRGKKIQPPAQMMAAPAASRKTKTMMAKGGLAGMGEAIPSRPGTARGKKIQPPARMMGAVPAAPSRKAKTMMAKGGSVKKEAKK